MEPIDWDKPICLDTVPPRMARVGHVYRDGSGAGVFADWRRDGRERWREVGTNGTTAWSDGIVVRNVRPGDFPAPADDIAAELAAALQCLAALPIDRNSRRADDDPIYGLDGHYITYGNVRDARAALAKWEARK